jgi:quinol monooxygenase YgiN
MLRLRVVLALALLGCLGTSPALAGDSRYDDRSDRIVVITHLDVIPTFVEQAQPVIEQFVVDSRRDPGVEAFIVISWTPTTNHFQLIEVYRNQRAFDAHISAAHTIEFRKELQAFIGAPYDERLYEVAGRF